MPISREYARSLFADPTQSAPVPLDPDELLHMPGLRQHGHVFFGDIAVRCYKHKARWTYDERDIRAAGRAFADMEVRLDDVADVQLPAYRDIPEHDPEEWHRPNWRRQLVSWMFNQALRKMLRETRHERLGASRHDDERDSWRHIGANGLPGELTWEEFVAPSSRYQYLQNIAGTRPLELLTGPGRAGSCRGLT
ncbi:hypothetical protein ACFTXM_49095 [Streptomyces sp. NPDC056930]|uniref:hypothetical protein n=1 Tax=Streptomyces sp. NPDC056930 TaxID=3345967 RepID=UPI00363805B2